MMTKALSMKSLTIIVLAAVIAVVMPAGTAMADYRDNRPLGGCSPVRSKTYFANDCRAHQVDSNGDAGYVLPRVNVGGVWQEAMHGINSTSALIDFLKNYSASSDERLYGPAAFIVHSMLGRGGDAANANGGKTISAADWAELEARLSGPGITFQWNELVDARFNTSGRVGGDVAFVDRGAGVGTRPSVVIRHNGTIVYVIQRECANPIGDLPGLPASSSSNLGPLIDANPHSVINIGDTFTFNYFIFNNGSSSAATSYTAEVKDSNGVPLTAPQTGSVVVTAGSQVQVATYTGNATASMGGQVCSTLSLSSGATPVTACIMIGKKPLFQVWNGDVWAGGSFGTGATCSIDSASPGNITGVGSGAGGSWSEYGAFAIGKIKGFGSAAQVRIEGGYPATRLTFANADPGNPGYIWGGPTPAPASGRCLTDFDSHFNKGSATTLNANNVNLQSLSSGVYHLTSNNVSIKAPQPISGKKIVLVSDDTVVIEKIGSANGIEYQNNPGAIDQLPLVVIIAKNIVINNEVSRVDAWLSASDTLSTCEVSGSLTDTTCNNQLEFNGPVVAGEVLMRRTYGSGDVPAEKFNLRPDAYLRAYADKSAPTQVRTIYQKELPPRY